MRTRLVENPVSASARWCASGRNRWNVIAIGGNARNTGPKQGFDGPGRERTAVSRYSIPRKTFGTSIDVISARKVATDDQRSTQEHGRSLQPVDTGPTKSTRLVTATGPFHLLNHGLRSMFAPLLRRDQGAFATRIRSLPNHIVMRSPSAYSRVARLMVPDLLHANRGHFYRDVGDTCIWLQWINQPMKDEGFPLLHQFPSTFQIHHRHSTRARLCVCVASLRLGFWEPVRSEICFVMQAAWRKRIKKEYKKNSSSLVDGTMTNDAATRSDTNDTQNGMYSCIVRENTESMGLPMRGDRSRKSV
jgi:hypothetical protein